MILSVIGTILLAILYIFLGLVGLILLILLLVMLSKLRYAVDLKYKDDLFLNVKASWLFGIVRVRYFIENGENKTIIKIFWRTLGNKNETTDKSDEVESDEEHKLKEHEPKEPPSKKRIEKEAKKEAEKAKDKVKVKDKAKDESKGVIESIKEKWEQFQSFEGKKIILDSGILLIKRLFKVIIPRKAYAQVTIGFDDPSLTAYIVGVCSWIRLAKYNRISVYGDYTKEVFDAEASFAGKLSLMDLTIPLIRFCFVKPVFRILVKVLFKKKKKVKAKNRKNNNKNNNKLERANVNV